MARHTRSVSHVTPGRGRTWSGSGVEIRVMHAMQGSKCTMHQTPARCIAQRSSDVLSCQGMAVVLLASP